MSSRWVGTEPRGADARGARQLAAPVQGGWPVAILAQAPCLREGALPLLVFSHPPSRARGRGRQALPSPVPLPSLLPWRLGWPPGPPSQQSLVRWVYSGRPRGGGLSHDCRPDDWASRRDHPRRGRVTPGRSSQDRSARGCSHKHPRPRKAIGLATPQLQKQLWRGQAWTPKLLIHARGAALGPGVWRQRADELTPVRVATL